MTGPVVFWNGQFIPQKEIGIPWHDAGFVFGATITDFCRTFRQQIYRWEDHLRRFRRNCHESGIDLPFQDDEITNRSKELLEANEQSGDSPQEICLILVATPGPIGFYSGQPGPIGPASFGMQTFPLPVERYQRFFREGVSLVTPLTRQISPANISPFLKHRSRLHWWLSEKEVHQFDSQGVPLLLDLHGNITETPLANFLLVQNGTILSPPKHTILDGISLQVVWELATELNLAFDEKILTLSDCLEAEEALITGTAFCLAGVRQINGRKIPWPGPIFQKLLKLWSQKVGTDIGHSFLAPAC
jgi:branched-chain amino acid aminotransferase